MPSLKIELVDVYEAPLTQACNVRLRHQTSGVLRVVNSAPKKSVTVTDLPSGVYQVQVDPAAFRAVGSFTNVGSGKPSALHLVFPIDPSKVSAITFPGFDKLAIEGQRILANTKKLFGYEDTSGAELYARLENDDTKRAGLLNILAKSSAVVFRNGRMASSYIQQILELRGDRFFAVVDKALREEAKDSVHDGLFREAPAGLHHPPAGFDHAGSFKTNDHYGNLQLTFFTDGTEWRSDIDIDDAAGLEHAFQVLRNELTNGTTNPYDIHEILVGFQKLDPGYTLNA